MSYPQILHQKISAHPPNDQITCHIIFSVAVFMPEVTSFVLSPRLVFTLTELLEGRHFCSRLCPQSLGDAWLRADTQGMFTNWPISRQSQLLGTWESSVYSSHRGPHTIEAATQHCASHSGSAWDCLFSERATWFLPLKDAKSKTGKKKKKKKSTFLSQWHQFHQ